MSTLETDVFVFKPDLKAIRQECNLILQRNPALTPNVKEALNAFEKAIQFIETRDNVQAAVELLCLSVQKVGNVQANELVASCLFYLGFFALQAGKNEMGVAFLESALAMTKDTLLMLNVLNRLMIFNLNSGDYDNVIQLANNSIEIARHHCHQRAATYYSACASYNIAEALFRQSRYANALSHLETAVAGFARISMTMEHAKARGLLGNALIMMDKVKEGLKCIEDSLAVFRKSNNKSEIAFLLQGRGIAMWKMGDIVQATKDLQEALRLFRQCGQAEAVNDTLAALATLEVR